MACNSIATGDAYKISARIAMLNEHLEKAYEELNRAQSSPEQYSIDTGNTRQFVIKQRIPSLQKNIEFYERKIAEHQARLDEINGAGGIATVIHPLMF